MFQVPPKDTKAAVRTALETGYRHVDTARIYRNEEAVGEAIAESGIAREELFITTKLWNDDQGYDSTLAAFETGINKLGLDYLDLYLIHWPTPAKDTYVDTWKAFETLYAAKRVRAIGVSNFRIQDLRRLIDLGLSVPTINQIELHPSSSRVSCAPSTPNTKSRPKRGAHSRKPRSSAKRPSSTSPKNTASPRPKSSSPGTLLLVTS